MEDQGPGEHFLSWRTHLMFDCRVRGASCASVEERVLLFGRSIWARDGIERARLTWLLQRFAYLWWSCFVWSRAREATCEGTKQNNRDIYLTQIYKGVPKDLWESLNLNPLDTKGALLEMGKLVYKAASGQIEESITNEFKRIRYPWSYQSTYRSW